MPATYAFIQNETVYAAIRESWAFTSNKVPFPDDLIRHGRVHPCAIPKACSALCPPLPLACWASSPAAGSNTLFYGPITLFPAHRFIYYSKVSKALLGGPVADSFGVWSGFLPSQGNVLLGTWLAWFLYSRKIFLRV